MALVQVLEHQRVAITDSPRGAEPAISTRLASALEQIEASLPSRAFEWGRDSIKFAQYCGVIAVGADTIEILPKIHGREQSPVACREILIRMLYLARRLEVPSGSANVELQRHDLLEVFIIDFCSGLADQLRRGMIRSYVTRVENSPVVRGKILIDRQIRLNHGHKERVWCQHDELMADNRPNQIIKFALRSLLRLARSPASQRRITELLYQFESVSDAPATAEDVGRVRLDRTTTRFGSTFAFCRWLLEGLFPDVASGEQACLSMLFDMNRLFEEVVAARLRPLVGEHGLSLRTQGPQRKLVRDRETEIESFVLRPDIALLDEEREVRSILDTKWKLLDPGERKLGVSQADLYQMAGYAGRYRCGRLALVYPRTAEVGDRGPVALDLIETGASVRICTVDVVELLQKRGAEHLRAALGVMF